MAANPRVPIDWGARKERFRAYMKAFNPNAPALEPIEAGLVAADLHDSLFETIAGRAEIEPRSQQVILGGTGSGKTTELLLTQQRLKERGLQPLYFEVSRDTDLAEAGPGTLVAILGRELIKRVPDDDSIAEAVQRVKTYASGQWVDLSDVYEEPDDDSVFIPGKLKPPIPAAVRGVQTIRRPLQQLLDAARPQGKS